MGPLIITRNMLSGLSLIFLVSCNTTGDFCDLNKPHRFTQEQIDRLTDEQAERYLAENRYGQKACGWRP